MQLPPLFKATCKAGTLIVDQMNISVVAPLNRLVWNIPRNSVTNVVQKAGLMTAEVEIYSVHGVYRVQTLSKPKANELVILLTPSVPQVQPPQSQTKNSQAPPQTAPPVGIPIDAEIQRIKLEIQQVRLQLSQVNANMANIRSHYQQSHVHGGGKVGGFVRSIQQSSKDAGLRKQQPIKERLQQQRLALEQQLAQLKILKAQGTTHITPAIKAK